MVPKLNGVYVNTPKKRTTMHNFVTVYIDAKFSCCLGSYPLFLRALSLLPIYLPFSHLWVSLICIMRNCRSDVDNGSNDDKKASASGNGNDPTPRKIQEGVLSSSPDGIIHANIVEAPLPQMMMNGVDISVVKDNGAHENGNGSTVSDSREKPKKKQHHRLCC